MNKKHKQELMRIFDFSDYEAEVYLAGLNMFNASVTDLSNLSNLPRTAVYPPLNSLIKRGFFSILTIGKQKKYNAIKPKNLMSMLDRERNVLQELISELTQSVGSAEDKISMQYFPGKEGILTASEIFLNETITKTWRVFEHLAKSAKTSGTMVIDEYIKRRLKKKIKVLDIIPADAKTTWVEKHISKDQEELRETIVVSPSVYPIESTIAITKGMVWLMNTDVNPFAVIIKNKKIALTLESIHKMVWERYKIG